MNESEARTVLLVRAIETADPDGRWLAHDARRAASEVVRASLPAPGRTLRPREWSERFLVKRAERLFQDAAARRGAWAAAADPVSPWPALRVVVVLAGLVAGATSDALVNPHRINLVSWPLLGVVAWNWAVFAAWVLSRPMRARRRPARWPAAVAARLAALFRPARGGRAVARHFVRAWTDAAAPLLHARLRATLHLGAAAVAVGLLGYVAATALPNEFRVGWESQLLKTAGAAHAFLQAVFWPASLLADFTGVAPFTRDEVAALHGWQGSTPALADRWLQLVAIVLVASVIVPRLALAGLQAWRARRLARDVPLDLTDPYFAGLLAGATGTRRRLVVWPYSVDLDDAKARRLAAEARRALDGETVVDLRPTTAYGARADALARKPAGAADDAWAEFAAMFSLSATPETETHGAFLDRVRALAGEHARVLLDRSGFDAKFGRDALGTERTAERLSLWTEFARQHGLSRVHVVDLGPADDAA